MHLLRVKNVQICPFEDAAVTSCCTPGTICPQKNVFSVWTGLIKTLMTQKGFVERCDSHLIHAEVEK